MRILYVLRGIPASGKSTFIQQNGLDPFVLSADHLRNQFESLNYNLDANPIIAQDNNHKVWKLLFELLEEKMKKGCLVVIDATHCDYKSIKKYFKLCDLYNYQLKIIDFEISLEEALKRNHQRVLHKVVPDYVIEKFYKQKQENLLSDLDIVLPNEYKKSVLYQTKDLSCWKKIIVFGDLQGCYSSLEEYFKVNDYNKNYLYIFCGDYIDRGIENSEVINWILSVYKKENFIFLRGNHEYHLERWANNLEAYSKTFENKTKKELEMAKIVKKEVKDFCKSLKDVFKFKYKDKLFLVSHGGFSFIPSDEQLNTIPAHQYIKGVGYYSDDIDDIFNNNTKENEYQIHGHRNYFNKKIRTKRSFNLESEIEYGGYLRILEIDEEFKEIEIKQNIFDKIIVKKKREKNMTFLEKLRSNELIKEKDLGNNISSFNFTRKAFYKGLWDKTNVKARGLFIDVKKEKIVARSYNKFFNLEERDETKKENLKKNLKFPLTVYQKDNGFLGILSMINNELFIASKSTNQGDFSRYFKDIIKQLNQNELKKILKGNFSMVFEVNDPINDPHMIKYEKPHVVLLDIIHNKEQFKKLPYAALKGIARKIGCQCKIKTIELNTWDDFVEWNNSVQNMNTKLEGYVVEDENLFMFKIKLPYYSFWKYMRTLKDRVRNKKEIAMNSLCNEGASFVKWCQSKDAKYLEKDIITLREDYLKNKGDI